MAVMAIAIVGFFHHDAYAETFLSITVGGNPFGLAVDPLTNTIYVANSYDNTVSVINGTTNTATSTITVGSGPTGVAVNPLTNTIYVANQYSHTVSVINGATNTVTSTIDVGSSPVDVAVNPSTNTIYVANFGSNTISVINGATNTVTSTIARGPFPEGVGVNPLTNTIYAVNLGPTVSVINGATNTVTSTITVGSSPTGVAVNPSINTIYVANFDSNTVSVINGATNTVTSTITIGGGLTGIGSGPLEVAVNPSTNTIYVTNYYAGKVSVISGSAFQYPTNTGITPNPSYVIIGNSITFDAIVSNGDAAGPGGSVYTPTGAVTFSDGETGGTFGSSTYTLAATTLDKSGCTISYTPSKAGPFTITATYSGDTTHNTSTGTSTLIVLTPGEATQNLINTANNMNLKSGEANSLDAKLQAAMNSLNSNDSTLAKNHLNAFINEVNAQTGKGIAQALAAELILGAQNIINSLH